LVTLIRTTSQDKDFQKLVVLLDEILKIYDGVEHEFFSQFNNLDTIKNVVVCYENNLPVGCGAFKEHDSKIIEIKRMFVLPEIRGIGIASKILMELELWASELNYTDCILETGTNNPNAISLYKKAGYFVTENYGQYLNVESSCCMKKIIK
jgi:putative acetyltransferase